MKTLFIPAKSKTSIDKSLIGTLKNLPSEIAIFYSIQFRKQAQEIKSLLTDTKISSFSQILGCSKPKISPSTKSILLIGSGKFHAISLAKETQKPVFILEKNNLSKISQEEISQIEKKQKASFLKFLSAKKIGILISTKPGQENLKKALALKKQIKNKSSYLYIANEINPTEFENFLQIDSWINTACPRLDMNSSTIVNIDRIKH